MASKAWHEALREDLDGELIAQGIKLPKERWLRTPLLLDTCTFFDEVMLSGQQLKARLIIRNRPPSCPLLWEKARVQKLCLPFAALDLLSSVLHASCMC